MWSLSNKKPQQPALNIDHNSLKKPVGIFIQKAYRLDKKLS
jgi:hypothetical protein